MEMSGQVPTAPIRKPIHTLKISEAKCLLEDRLQHAIGNHDHQAFVFSGELRNLKQAKSRVYNGRIFGAKLVDRTESIELVLRLEDVAQYNDGDVVMLYAAPSLKEHNWNVKPQLVVYRIAPAPQEQVIEQQQANIAGLDLLKRMKSQSNLFPTQLPVQMTVIYSRASTAQVFSDFSNSLGSLPNLIVQQRQVSFSNTAELIQAISTASKDGTDILVIIRGGGNDDEFKVFEQEAVMKAFSDCPAYRVTGLGHTANKTLLDFLSEYPATTPTNAGEHIRIRYLNDLTSANLLIEVQKNNDLLLKEKITAEQQVATIRGQNDLLLKNSQQHELSLARLQNEAQQYHATIAELKKEQQHSQQWFRILIALCIVLSLFLVASIIL